MRGRAAGEQSQSQTADRQERDQLFDANRPDDLKAGGDDHRIGKRRVHRGFCRLCGMSPGLLFPQRENNDSNQRHQKENPRAGQAGCDQAIVLQDVDESGGAEK